MTIIAIIIATLLVLAPIAICVYLCVDAYQSTKRPTEWAKFLDDAGVKKD